MERGHKGEVLECGGNVGKVGRKLFGRWRGRYLSNLWNVRGGGEAWRVRSFRLFCVLILECPQKVQTT